MAKRDKKTISFDDLRKWHLFRTLFVWKECDTCHKEFRRERGWVRLSGVALHTYGEEDIWGYRCDDCMIQSREVV
jgi:hypothetical protein